MDATQMIENFQVLLLQTEERQWQDAEEVEKRRRQEAEEAEKRQDEKLIQEAEEAEKRHDEKCRQEREEWKRETEDIKALIQEQKQIQEHSLSLIHI